MFLVLVVLFMMFVMFLLGLCVMLAGRLSFHRLGACHERRKALKQLIEIFPACQQLLNLHPDLGTLVRRLFKGTIIAGMGHCVVTSLRY